MAWAASSVRTWCPPQSGRSADRSWADIAFGLGVLYETEDDLEQAVRWFRYAAESDRPGAALRLSAVLLRLADRRGDSEDLLAEASRRLSEGLDAAGPESMGTESLGMVTEMLDRHHRQAARRGPATT